MKVEILLVLLLSLYPTFVVSKLVIQPNEDFIDCTKNGKLEGMDISDFKIEAYNDTYYYLIGKRETKKMLENFSDNVQ